jgi:predicted secreted protein
MKWTSVLAIYLLFWVMTAFFVLPIGIRTAEEAGTPLVPGQSQSAPSEFRPSRIILRTTIAATLFFALYYLNYVNGWITADQVIALFPQI